MWSLPSHLSSWQQGQPIPQGYRLGKSGRLRPVNYTWSSSSFTSTTPMHTNVLPAQVEFRERPAVVQEVIKPGLREEIQPVIHRDREQLEIREEIQPIYEKGVRSTIVEERQLAPELRPEVRMGQMPVIAPGPRGGVVVEAEQRQTVMHTPIAEETIHKKIIEEVQPVIHREVIAPRVIHETKDIYEKVVETPVVSYSTLPPKFSGQTQYSTTTTTTSYGFSSWQPGQPLPGNVMNWKQGQAIPEGWRLGRKGFLKPAYNLPPHLSTWQQGQTIPEGYRLSKHGALKPAYLYNFGDNYSKFQQQPSYLPTTVQRF